MSALPADVFKWKQKRFELALWVKFYNLLQEQKHSEEFYTTWSTWLLRSRWFKFKNITNTINYIKNRGFWVSKTTRLLYLCNIISKMAFVSTVWYFGLSFFFLSFNTPPWYLYNLYKMLIYKMLLMPFFSFAAMMVVIMQNYSLGRWPKKEKL